MKIKTLFDIESYRTRFLGGARQYLFFVMFNLPGDIPQQNSGGGIGSIMDIAKSALSTFGLGSGKSEDYLPYLVKSLSLPESSYDEVRVPYQIIDNKMAGKRLYNDWTVTLNVDEKYGVLDKFYGWQKLVESNLPSKYMTEKQQVFLLDYTGNTIKSYDLYYSWPKTIGNIAMDYSSNDIATVDITFSYLWHEIGKGSQSSGTSDLIKRAFGSLSRLI